MPYLPNEKKDALYDCHWLLPCFNCINNDYTLIFNTHFDNIVQGNSKQFHPSITTTSLGILPKSQSHVRIKFPSIQMFIPQAPLSYVQTISISFSLLLVNITCAFIPWSNILGDDWGIQPFSRSTLFIHKSYNHQKSWTRQIYIWCNLSTNLCHPFLNIHAIDILTVNSVSYS